MHNIALARRLISDDECEECFTKSDAEGIVLSQGTGLVLGADPETDDDIGKPTSGTDEELNLGAANLIGAPDRWMPPSAPINFPRLQAQVRRTSRGIARQSCWVESVHLHPKLSPKGQKL